jgi:nicotinamidase-related amidase
MPLTQIEPNAALIVIDLQKGIVGLPTAHPTSDVVAKSAEIAKAFRQRGLPVVLVNVAGRAPGRTDAGMPNIPFPPDWTELVPELDQQPSDYLVTKHSFGGFLGTKLDEYLKSRGVTQVFFVGVATSIGVESSARSAFDLGYHVVFVPDAMTDLHEVAHQHSVEKIFPRMGEVETAENVLKALRS